jgi:uncharacterized repeat protein (TIGR01451 family)
MKLRQHKTNSSARAKASKVFKALAISATSFLALILIGTSLVSGNASAEGNAPKTEVWLPNEIRAYVGSGEKLDAQFTKTFQPLVADRIAGKKSTVDIYKTGDGDNPSATCSIDAADPVGTNCAATLSGLTSSQPGVWRIRIDPNRDGSSTSSRDRFTWKVEVKSGATTKSGRVWSISYNIAQMWPSSAEYQGNADIEYWYLSREGYLYNAQYPDYNGVGSYFYANPYGLVHANTCTPAYKSYTESNVGAGKAIRNPAEAASQCGGQYKLFFKAPAGDLPEEAANWRGDTEWVSKPIKTPKIDGVKFVKTIPDTGVRTGSLEFNVEGYSGTAKVSVDANDDGQFNGPTDFTESVRVASGQNSYQYLGVDKAGNPIPNNQKVNFQIRLENLAEIHFTNGDAEHRAGGIKVSRLNGPVEGRSNISWDDSELPDDVPTRCSLIGPATGTDVSSSNGVHGWKGMGASGESGVDAACSPFAAGIDGNDKDPYGNYRYIEDWTRVKTNISLDYSLPAELSSDLSLVKTILDTPQVVKNGDTVKYQISVTNSGPDTAENVEVTDKPSEKLEYISNTTSIGTFVPAELKWKIPKIEIDQTVTLELSFRVKDATPEITNLAEIISSGNPDNDSTPNNCAGGTKLEDDCAVSTLNLGKAIGAPKTGAIVGAIIVSVATLSLAGYLMKEVYDKREMKLKSQK